jgi:hypothetical protein
MKSLNFIFEDEGHEWGYKSIFLGFQKYCVQNVSDINFNCISSVDMRHTGYNGPAEKYGPMYCMIENPETKKYILISYWDKLTDVISTFDLENCVDVYSSTGGHTNDITFDPIDFNYIPISYVVTKTFHEQEIENAYHNIIPYRKQDKLLFRGFIYLFRKYLISDSRFNVTDEKVSFEEYIQDARKNYVNLNLNGAAELNQRDMELLGTGTAMLRLKLSTKFHNELIPDYHYISVKFDDLDSSDKNIFYKNLSNRILDRYNEVKDDIDYLKFVGENGRKWYQENGTVQANIDILTKLVNFNKLF